VPETVAITASYAFFDLEEAKLKHLQTALTAFGKTRGMRGLVLVATEGINSTVSGTSEVIAEWKKHLTEQFGAIVFKDSSASRQVFRRFSVKIKPEIVGLKQQGIKPAGKHKHLSPAEWQQMLEKEDVVLIDTRNDYEVAIGKFAGAIDPQIKSFQEFPEYVKQSALPKDKKVMMYCTGGIRCEKALLEMEKQGYENVYQLEGGILAYLQAFPHKDFQGECFVFDHRVAVNQELQPSEHYGLCPHCGNPGDRLINCFCGTTKKVCEACAKDETQKTCSKRCRNELRKKQTLSLVRR
jgi:UPF0176 protein